jgi:hypothetical protein
MKLKKIEVINKIKLHNLKVLGDVENLEEDQIKSIQLLLQKEATIVKEAIIVIDEKEKEKDVVKV